MDQVDQVDQVDQGARQGAGEGSFEIPKSGLWSHCWEATLALVSLEDPTVCLHRRRQWEQLLRCWAGDVQQVGRLDK